MLGRSAAVRRFLHEVVLWVHGVRHQSLSSLTRAQISAFSSLRRARGVNWRNPSGVATRSVRLAESFLEPKVVADGGEIVVPSRLFSKWLVELD